MNLQCFGSNVASLLTVEIKFKMALMFRNYWMQYFYIAILSRIKILEHIMFDSLEAKENHLADISARNAIFKGTNNSQTSVIIHRDISSNDTLEKTGYRRLKIGFSKRKKQDWKCDNCLFGKKRKVWFGSNNSVLSETLKNPLLITVHTPNQWFIDKMMNKYC